MQALKRIRSLGIDEMGVYEVFLYSRDNHRQTRVELCAGEVNVLHPSLLQRISIVASGLNRTKTAARRKKQLRSFRKRMLVGN